MYLFGKLQAIADSAGKAMIIYSNIILFDIFRALIVTSQIFGCNIPSVAELLYYNDWSFLLKSFPFPRKLNEVLLLNLCRRPLEPFLRTMRLAPPYSFIKTNS